MSAKDVLPVNFTISDAAKQAADTIRAEYDAAMPGDPAAVLCVAWGIVVPHAGARSEGVVVGYYQQSQLADVAVAIQEVSGVRLVFFTTEEHHGKFAGKILDFSPERRFFLRAP